MSNFQDPYKVLGIDRSASEEEVKKVAAYKKAALRTHPDKVPAEQKAEAEIQFRSISEAYEILKDPTMRQRFDTFGMEGVRNGTNGAGSGGRTNRSSYTAGGGNFGGFPHGAFFHDPRSIFEEFFGGRDPFADTAFFADPFNGDPFQRRSTRFQQQQQQQQPGTFNHPFFSPFPSMMQQPMSMGSGGFSSFSSSSSSYGSRSSGSGSFRSQSSQTQIINGERTTTTTIQDENGTRVETVVVGRDGKEKKRQIVENGKVVLSLEGGQDRMLEGNSEGGRLRRSQ
ncbi:DnaJ domain-containing protein [Obelidium mucronatum]|nr:DnaJ domain-containing protein [Obelidium mucronatum]